VFEAIVTTKNKLKNYHNIYKQNSSDIIMNKWLELLIGLVLVIIAAAAWISNFHSLGTAAWQFLKGGVVWLIILVGLLFLALGISDLKE
jgi:hypothetical protein